MARTADGLVPFPVMPVAPLSGFALRDDTVVIETLTGEQRISDPEEVTVYPPARRGL